MSDLDTLLDETMDAEPSVSPIADRENTDESVAETGANQASSEPQAAEVRYVPPAIPMSGTQIDPRTFNPDFHVVDDAGNPVKNKDGSYKKKPGRKKGQTNGPQTERVQATVIDSDHQRLQKAHASATVCVQSLFMLGQLIGGEDFKPIVDPVTGQDEPAMLTQAYTQYFLTQDDFEIPPWIGVAIVTSSYVLTRITLPKTQSRLATIWGWLSGLFSKSETEDEK